MNSKQVRLLLASAAVAVVAMGCPSGNESADVCTADTDCGSGSICHPVEKVCVQTCESAADCPDSAKNCEGLNQSTGTDGGTQTSDAGVGQKICKCATSVLCNGLTNPGGSLVCNDETRVCVTKCGSDADCGSGRTCDTASGQCKAGSGGTCTPACATGQTCQNGTCVTQQTTCNSSNAQPDVCAYGQFCSSNVCTAVPAPTCVNFDPTQGGKAPVFDASTSTGPIIYSITKETQDATWCNAGGGEPDNVRVRVKAYNKNGTFPANSSGVSGFFYVRVNGSQVDATTLIRPQSGYSVTNGGKEAEFLVNFCLANNIGSISIGMYFTGGNEYCAQVSK